MKWIIERLDALPSLGDVTNYCVTAFWRVSHEEDGFSATAYGSCSFPVPEVAPEIVAPFAALTEAQVLGWVWANGVDKDATEAAVAAQIAVQRNPPIVSPPLPWAG